MNDLVPVARFDVSQLQFLTCDEEHIKVIKKYYKRQNRASVYKNIDTQTLGVLITSFVKNIARDKKEDLHFQSLKMFIHLLDKYPELNKFIIIRRISVHATKLRTFKSVSVGYSENGKTYTKVIRKQINDSRWTEKRRDYVPKSREVIRYFYIYMRPEIVSFMKQKFVFVNEYEKVMFNEMLDYIQSMFTETEINKELVKKEIDNLLQVCKRTYNKEEKVDLDKIGDKNE